jgi:CRP/FNR family transcriptional regulator
LIVEQVEAFAAADIARIDAVSERWRNAGRMLDAAWCDAAAALIADRSGDATAGRRLAVARQRLRDLGVQQLPPLLANARLDSNGGRDISDMLRGLSFLSAVGDEAIASVIEDARVSEYGRGQRVAAPSDEEFALVARGHVFVQRALNSGKSLTVGLLGAGSIVALTRADDAHALEGATLVSIRWRKLADLGPVGIELSRRVSEQLAEQAQDVTARLALFAGASVDQRVADLLERLDRQVGRDTLDGGRILDAPLTHADLASIAGTRRESVTQVLGALEDDGVISKRGRRIVLRDRERLAELAAGAA